MKKKAAIDLNEHAYELLRAGKTPEFNAFHAAFREKPHPRLMMSGKDLNHVDLRGADLREVFLWGTNLQGAKLEGANLFGAVLHDATLEGATYDDATRFSSRTFKPEKHGMVKTPNTVGDAMHQAGGVIVSRKKRASWVGTVQPSNNPAGVKTVLE